MHILIPTIRRRSLSRGFTIIETLVAITILMIAVAGPLVIATRGLTSALVSKNQMIASYLAQDTLEMIKNKRDGNVANHQDTIEVNWLDGFGTSCGSASTLCDIGGIDDNNNVNTNDISTCAVAGCDMYYSDTSGYSHNTGTGSKSIFRRGFFFSDPGQNNGKSERLVHVVVNWNEGTVPYQVSVTSQLVAVSR